MSFEAVARIEPLDGRPFAGPSRDQFSVLVYTGDCLGLGHLRRNTMIAARLVQDLPGTNVLLLTGLSCPSPFEVPAGVDLIKLPSVRKTAPGCYEPRTLSVDPRRMTWLRTSIIDDISRTFNPDLLVVDHLPTGINGDLLPTLVSLHARSNRPRVVLGLRDFVDDTERTRSLWRAEGVLEAIHDFYDEVLIYGCREVFDTEKEYGLDAATATSVHYCGYLCSDGSATKGGPSPLGHGTDRGRRIVVTAGGGADGFPMMRLSIEALGHVASRIGVDVTVVTGPFMPQQHRAELAALFEHCPGRMLWCIDRLPELLEGADLVITMAGYNTLMEVIGLGKRPLVIPRAGPSAEQRMRAEVFSRRGLVRMAEDHELSPSALADVVLECLDAPPPAGTLPGMDGVAVAAGRLKALLTEARPDRHSSSTRAASRPASISKAVVRP